MSTLVNTTGDRYHKRISLPFIGRCLKDSGLEVRRDGNAYYADLSQEKDLLIGLKNDILSVAVALPVNEEETEIVSILADTTMASTTMTKVFRTPGRDGMNMWFAVETPCTTRDQFEKIFDNIFKLLLDSVRTYIRIRIEIEETMRVSKSSQTESDLTLKNRLYRKINKNKNYVNQK